MAKSIIVFTEQFEVSVGFWPRGRARHWPFWLTQIWAREVLGYEPKINLTYGIKNFIEWAKDELNFQKNIKS